MAAQPKKRQENVPGKYWVDDSCTDCYRCLRRAPKNFARNEAGFAYVVKQPESWDEELRCRDAMKSCMMRGIHDDGERAAGKNSRMKEDSISGENPDVSNMPIFMLLVRVGKRVLRPGGMELTRRMLDLLDIQSSDHVVEFAPGVGATAQLTLTREPAQYTAIERDEALRQRVSSYLHRPNQRCVEGRAEQTGLPDASATVVYGEAMLSMQPVGRRKQVIQEAARILKPGGRYALHEICLKPDDLNEDTKSEIEGALSRATRVPARPLTRSEWRELLEAAGLHIQHEVTLSFHLLEIRRMISDEGVLGTLRILSKLLTDGAARRRILALRRAIRQHQKHLSAICIVASKNE